MNGYFSKEKRDCTKIWKIILLGIAGQFVSSFDLFLQNTINLSKKLEIFYWEMLWNPYKISLQLSRSTAFYWQFYKKI